MDPLIEPVLPWLVGCAAVAAVCAVGVALRRALWAPLGGGAVVLPAVLVGLYLLGLAVRGEPPVDFTYFALGRDVPTVPSTLVLLCVSLAVSFAALAVATALALRRWDRWTPLRADRAPLAAAVAVLVLAGVAGAAHFDAWPLFVVPVWLVVVAPWARVPGVSFGRFTGVAGFAWALAMRQLFDLSQPSSSVVIAYDMPAVAWPAFLLSGALAVLGGIVLHGALDLVEPAPPPREWSGRWEPVAIVGALALVPLLGLVVDELRVAMGASTGWMAKRSGDVEVEDVLACAHDVEVEDGVFWLDRRLLHSVASGPPLEVSLDQLRGRVSETAAGLLHGGGGIRVCVRASTDLPWEAVEPVLAALRDARVADVLFVGDRSRTSVAVRLLADAATGGRGWLPTVDDPVGDQPIASLRVASDGWTVMTDEASGVPRADVAALVADVRAATRGHDAERAHVRLDVAPDALLAMVTVAVDALRNARAEDGSLPRVAWGDEAVRP